jgi:CheY-like chemotaxis protein
VLVIDDDPAVRDLLQRFLTKEGFAVKTASSGGQGLELARSLKPAVITLDVMMPGMDGWAVLSSIKADPVLNDTPVVVVTIVDDKNIGFSLGAAEYLTKPIDWNRLAVVMNKFRRQPGQKVLVVEDEADCRERLRRTLEKDGWQVAVAENGRSALNQISDSLPAAILLDLIMPEMDGFEFMSQLRDRPEWRHIPVIVITAKDLTPEDRQRLQGQIQDVLQKGVYSAEELLRDVHTAATRTARPNVFSLPKGEGRAEDSRLG